MEQIKLLPYQQEDLPKFKVFNDRVLLGWECGLGKTIEVLSRLRETIAKPVIIVCPAGLKLNWQREAARFDMRTQILSGRTPTNEMKKHLRYRASMGDLLIINYDILYHTYDGAKWLQFLKSLKPKVIVGDEIQKIAGMRSLRSRSFTYLCKDVPYLYFLSGTPLLHKPFDLYPTISLLWPETFNSPFSFGFDYCEATKVRGKWAFPGAKRLPELHKKLISLGMIRRTKEEVLPQLPPKRRIIVPLELSPKDRKEYDLAERDLILWLASWDTLKAQKAAYTDRRVKFGYLKRLAAKLKMNAVMENIDLLLEEGVGKVLLGVIHRATTATLLEKYKNFAVIDGRKTAKQRERAELLFQTDPNTPGLIGQIQACGLGLNLTTASEVGMIELPWSPADCQQFEARPHRVTTKHPINVRYFIAANTIEEKLCEILQRKQLISDQTLDGVKMRGDSLNIFDLLTRSLLEKGTTSS